MSEQDTLKRLDLLIAELRGGNSVWRKFLSGVIYGVGFFVGSAIIATIALGLLGPWFAQIYWIRNAFETGLLLLHGQ